MIEDVGVEMGIKVQVGGNSAVRRIKKAVSSTKEFRYLSQT